MTQRNNPIPRPAHMAMMPNNRKPKERTLLAERSSPPAGDNYGLTRALEGGANDLRTLSRFR